ncbi:hypothetical protein H0H87_009281 [Tephrocybe sp. NHM501043]|nr:hypothetical protein H0H87_009281 [Tephrocybe sp. NHM501043]
MWVSETTVVLYGAVTTARTVTFTSTCLITKTPPVVAGVATILNMQGLKHPGQVKSESAKAIQSTWCLDTLQLNVDEELQTRDEGQHDAGNGDNDVDKAEDEIQEEMR